MPRPRHPVPSQLRSIRHDPIEGKYFITEDNITYYLTLEHTRLLKEYFRGKSSVLIFDWYNSLDKETRVQIKTSYKK